MRRNRVIFGSVHFSSREFLKRTALVPIPSSLSQRWLCHPISPHAQNQVGGSPLMPLSPPPSTASPSPSPLCCILNLCGIRPLLPTPITTAPAQVATISCLDCGDRLISSHLWLPSKHTACPSSTFSTSPCFFPPETLPRLVLWSAPVLPALVHPLDTSRSQPSPSEAGQTHQGAHHRLREDRGLPLCPRTTAAALHLWVMVQESLSSSMESSMLAGTTQVTYKSCQFCLKWSQRSPHRLHLVWN